MLAPLLLLRRAPTLTWGANPLPPLAVVRSAAPALAAAAPRWPPLPPPLPLPLPLPPGTLPLGRREHCTAPPGGGPPGARAPPPASSPPGAADVKARLGQATNEVYAVLAQLLGPASFDAALRVTLFPGKEGEGKEGDTRLAAVAPHATSTWPLAINIASTPPLPAASGSAPDDDDEVTVEALHFMCAWLQLLLEAPPQQAMVLGGIDRFPARLIIAAATAPLATRPSASAALKEASFGALLYAVLLPAHLHQTLELEPTAARVSFAAAVNAIEHVSVDTESLAHTAAAYLSNTASVLKEADPTLDSLFASNQPISVALRDACVSMATSNAWKEPTRYVALRLLSIRAAHYAQHNDDRILEAACECLRSSPPAQGSVREAALEVVYKAFSGGITSSDARRALAASPDMPDLLIQAIGPASQNEPAVVIQGLRVIGKMFYGPAEARDLAPYARPELFANLTTLLSSQPEIALQVALTVRAVASMELLTPALDETKAKEMAKPLLDMLQGGDPETQEAAAFAIGGLSLAGLFNNPTDRELNIVTAFLTPDFSYDTRLASWCVPINTALRPDSVLYTGDPERLDHLVQLALDIVEDLTLNQKKDREEENMEDLKVLRLGALQFLVNLNQDPRTSVRLGRDDRCLDLMWAAATSGWVQAWNFFASLSDHVWRPLVQRPGFLAALGMVAVAPVAPDDAEAKHVRTRAFMILTNLVKQSPECKRDVLRLVPNMEAVLKECAAAAPAGVSAPGGKLGAEEDEEEEEEARHVAVRLRKELYGRG